jgi:hypothetical protein
MNGGERTKVCEHLSVVYFEVEACPEPKSLKKSDLKFVLEGLGTVAAVLNIQDLAGRQPAKGLPLEGNGIQTPKGLNRSAHKRSGFWALRPDFASKAFRDA